MFVRHKKRDLLRTYALNYAMMSTHLQTWRQCLRVPWTAADSLWVWQIRRSSLGLKSAVQRVLMRLFAFVLLFRLLCSFLVAFRLEVAGAKDLRQLLR